MQILNNHKNKFNDKKRRANYEKANATIKTIKYQATYYQK